ncbi:MAG: acyltransferase [Bacteroidales bacterium]|jgi:peptidoglycan/LPS O-acetylase OafA/YrhL|nr:acyltransferase [Bacteroidales bacterium]
MAKFRVGYIDMLRGFTMLWVVCLHLNISIGIANDFRMPILFFISGIFFKIRPFPEFFLRKTNMILIPLLFFWFISWICAIIQDEFIPVHFNLSQVNWGSVFDLLDKYSYMKINILWFLIVLYVINLFYYPLVRYLNRNYILLTGVILYLTAGYIDSKIQMQIQIFHMWRFLTYQLFFVLGIFYGRKMLEWLAKNTRQLYVVLGACLVVFAVCQVIDWEAPYFNMAPKRLYNLVPSFALVIMLFWLFSKLEKFKIMEFFRFFGANSLTIYASHVIIQNYVLLVFLDPFVKRHFNVDDHKTLYGWFLFFMICGIGYISIRFFNRCLPQFAGKKDFFKLPEPKVLPAIKEPEPVAFRN